MSSIRTLTKTNLALPNQTQFYQGKVRDVYTINDTHVVLVATDRISAFDVVLAQGIPHKGQVLNQLAVGSLEATRTVVPNWFISTPHPNVSIGWKAQPYPIEMVVRGYLTGHAWREYAAGKRQLCGEHLPHGLNEHDKLPEPIITPTTKAQQGHDEDISRQHIIDQKLVSEADYAQLERYALALFDRGTTLAAKRGLILVDTKYEFGKTADGTIVLIDEVHTPDSSRFFYRDGYEERHTNDGQPRQLSKEYVRQWLLDHNFSGQSGQSVPELPSDFVASVSQRYLELFRQLAGRELEPVEPNIAEIEAATAAALSKLA